MSFLPSPQVRFALSVAKGVGPSIGLDGEAIELPEVGCSASATVLWAHHTSAGRRKAEGIVCGSLVAGPRTPAESVRFHIVNLAPFVGTAVQAHTRADGGLHIWWGRAEMRFGPWVAVMDAPPDASRRWDEARAAKGYAITHVGELRRQDGTEFTFEDSATAFEFLHWALSFANGARCDCVLRRGLSAAGETAWDEWGVGQVAPAASRHRWITDRPLGPSFTFARGLYALWGDPQTREWLRLAIGLYTAANCESVREIGLITGQITLELLVSALLERPSVTLPSHAYQRLRMLLNHCGIPLEVPPELRDIHKTFPPVNPVDGPEAVTRIRNRLAHPTEENRRKLRQVIGNGTYEAAQLTLWYIEMVLLHEFGYTGHHWNRTKAPQRAGAKERVPWV